MNGRQCNVLIAAQTCVSVCVGGEGQLVMPAPPEADYTEEDIVLFGIKLLLTSSTKHTFKLTHTYLPTLFSNIYKKRDQKTKNMHYIKKKLGNIWLFFLQFYKKKK